MNQKSWMSGPKQEFYSTPDPRREKPAFDLLKQLLLGALNQNATDLHFEPKQALTIIRIRVDGNLLPFSTCSLEQYELYRRMIKLYSHLNIAENRLPQEGGFSFENEKGYCDIRVSFMQTIFGEKCALRFLPSKERYSSCFELGFTTKQAETIGKGLQNCEGSVIISGPTGSGKSTTLHTLLKLLPKKSLHIISIEDPVEIKDQEINQMEVQEELGLSYKHLLRGVMRLDPDVLLLGEIRDKETARYACEAALTGHFFLTTIHTKTTFDIVLRLIEMGIEPYLIASSLSLLVSERLVRKTCPACSEKMDIAYLPLNKNGIFTQQKGKGCNDCQFTGYKGRQGVFEVVQISTKTRNLIANFSLTPDMEQLRLSFYEDCEITLHQAMIELIRNGVTNWEEVVSQLENLE